MDQCAFNALHVDTRGRSLYYIRAKGARSLALLATRQTCKPQRLSLIGYAPNWISYVPPSWSTWRVQKHKRGGFMLLIYDYEKQHFAPWLLNSRFEGPEHREKRRKKIWRLIRDEMQGGRCEGAAATPIMPDCPFLGCWRLLETPDGVTLRFVVIDNA